MQAKLLLLEIRKMHLNDVRPSFCQICIHSKAVSQQLHNYTQEIDGSPYHA